MSLSASPRREHSFKKNKTIDLSANKSEKPPVDSRPITPRSSFARSARTSSLPRHNKIYRGPPTPSADILYARERSFILDCRAVANISNDYSTANPKLGSVIPPYIAQYDYQVDDYFDSSSAIDALEKTGQSTDPESVAGRVYDRFHRCGHGFRYLSRRNKFGAGHSIEQIRGHELFLSNPKPVINYNGLFGYRRNTPALRYQPIIGIKKLDANTPLPLGRYSIIASGKPDPFHCQCKFDEPCRCHNQDKLCPCIKA